MNEIVSRLTSDARELGRRELPALVESLAVTADGKRGLLRLRGAAEARVVVGQDCSEVLAGAALITAIAFGAGLEREPSPPELASTSEPSRSPQPASPPEPASAPEPSAALEVARDRPSIALESDERRVAAVALDGGAEQQAAPPAAAARWAVGAGAGAHTGVAPWPAGVFDVAFELSWPDRGWSLRARGSLGLARALVGERSARFVFVGGGLELCPMLLGVHLGWQWGNCIGFELGRVHAEGEAESALASAEKGGVWWAAPGLVTRLQSPRLQGVRFELEGGVNVPLWHREFEFHDPDVSVFETPLLALTARFGLQIPLE